MLVTLAPLPESQIIQYQDEDFRQLERIYKWEAKIKEGVPINDALRPEQQIDFDEDAPQKEEKARNFIEKMQKETMERNLRFKLKAEKRLAALEQEEKEKEKIRCKELIDLVKKRQQETLLKLQAVSLYHQAKEKREIDLEERKRFVERVSLSHKYIKPVVPLFVRLEQEHHMKSKLWYDQFSRKELAKMAGENQGSVSEESFGGHRRSGQVTTLTFNNPTKRLKLPVHRHTEMNLHPSSKKLEKVEQIDKINDEIRQIEKAIKRDNKVLERDKFKKMLKSSASSPLIESTTLEKPA